MSHKFEPADEKYWADQRLKHQAAILRQKQALAEKTNFTDLFEEETANTNQPQQK